MISVGFRATLIQAVASLTLLQDDPGFASQSQNTQYETSIMNTNWAASAGVSLESLPGGLQIHRAGPSLVILRQSKDLHFEAPFLYLVFGTQRAVLIDTGAISSSAECPLQVTIDELMQAHYGQEGVKKIELVVVHSHAHGDHQEGDAQFIGKDRTQVISSKQAGQFFGLVDWPRGIGSIDLGDRSLAVVPIPGHEGHDIALYDPKTAILFSGDSLYPGRLYIRAWQDYRESMERLSTYLSNKPLQWILGAHVEMSKVEGVDFPQGARSQAFEHPLELQRSDLHLLLDRLREIGDKPRVDVQAKFIIRPQLN